MIAEVLYELITGSNETNQYIGDRMYPNALPKVTSFDKCSSDLPAIIYAMSGMSVKDEIDLCQTMWDLTVTCNTAIERDTVCNAVKKVLHRFKGGPIWYIGFSSRTDMFDEETGKPYAVLTFIVTSYGEEV